jgi:hypothetical protein
VSSGPASQMENGPQAQVTRKPWGPTGPQAQVTRKPWGPIGRMEMEKDPTGTRDT